MAIIIIRWEGFYGEQDRVHISKNGVISKNQLNKSLFARVAKNKEMLAFPCEERRDSHWAFKENFPQLTFL